MLWSESLSVNVVGVGVVKPQCVTRCVKSEGRHMSSVELCGEKLLCRTSHSRNEKRPIFQHQHQHHLLLR